MGNWDHLSNIGLHPIHDTDPDIRIPARIDAGRNRADRNLSDLRTLGVATTVTLTIGRNVGDVPLDVVRWQHFRSLTRQGLANLTAPDFSAEYNGVGVWEGVEEDSTTFVASGVTTLDRKALRNLCAALCADFGQDAIALTIGETELVES